MTAIATPDDFESDDLQDDAVDTFDSDDDGSDWVDEEDDDPYYEGDMIDDDGAMDVPWWIEQYDEVY